MSKETVKITGLAEVRLELRQYGERTVNHATRQMRRTAERIEKKAKEYVPEDSEALKESIRVIEDRGFRGRLQFDVVVGGQVADRDAKHAYQVDVDLDRYAWRIHEHYEDMQPGEKTIAKMERVGRDKVGSGFLRRAADEEYENLKKKLFDGFNNVIISDKY